MPKRPPMSRRRSRTPKRRPTTAAAAAAVPAEADLVEGSQDHGHRRGDGRAALCRRPRLQDLGRAHRLRVPGDPPLRPVPGDGRLPEPARRRCRPRSRPRPRSRCRHRRTHRHHRSCRAAPAHRVRPQLRAPLQRRAPRPRHQAPLPHRRPQPGRPRHQPRAPLDAPVERVRLDRRSAGAEGHQGS